MCGCLLLWQDQYEKPPCVLWILHSCVNKIKFYLSLYLSSVPNSIHDSHKLKEYFLTRVWLIIFMTLHFLSRKVYFDPLCTHSLMDISIAKAFKNIYSMQHHQSRISLVHSSEGYPPISWHTALIWPGTSNKRGGGLAAPVHKQSYTYGCTLPAILDPKPYYTPVIPRGVSEGRPMWQWTIPRVSSTHSYMYMYVYMASGVISLRPCILWVSDTREGC